MNKYILSAFCLTGSILLQANPALKKMILRMERDPRLTEAFMTIMIRTQEIPHPTLTAAALRCLAEAYIAHSVSEAHIDNEEGSCPE